MSAIIEKALPFPRGSTYSDAKRGANSLVTLSDSGPASNLEGKLYQVKDTIHNTGIPVILRVVKNDSGGDLAVARKWLSFRLSNAATTPGDWGRRVDGVAGTGGEPCKPMDDAYYYGTEDTSQGGLETTIAQYDLFYVVEAGPCLVEGQTGVAAGSAGDAVQMAGAGRNGKAAAADTVVATYLKDGTTSEVTAELVNVHFGLQTGVQA